MISALILYATNKDLTLNLIAERSRIRAELGVWSKYSCGVGVVFQQATETLAATDRAAPTGMERFCRREE